MFQTVFNCNISTPMFIYGATKKYNYPELRPPSIKGVLQYFWRALQSETCRKSLLIKESKLFGSADPKIGASKLKLSLTTSSYIKQCKEEVLYHKKNFKKEAFVPNPDKKNDSDTDFSLIIRSNNEENQKHFAYLAFLVSLIGGIGSRSRRARGCFEVLSCNGEFSKEINSLIENLNNPNFSELDVLFQVLNTLVPDKYEKCNSQNCIDLIDKSMINKYEYPVIQKIQLEKPFETWKKLLENIDNASHEVNTFEIGGIKGSDYTGYAVIKGRDKERMDKTNRLSSPLYISTFKKNTKSYIPVIIYFTPVFKNDAPQTKDYSSDFIRFMKEG